jgi:GDP-D-mannose dehydratase
MANCPPVQSYFSPSEAVELRGDASLARRELGWAPSKRFEEMVESDLRALQDSRR